MPPVLIFFIIAYFTTGIQLKQILQILLQLGAESFSFLAIIILY